MPKKRKLHYPRKWSWPKGARIAVSLNMALELLFAETDHVRCGQRLLVDRIFEVVVIQLMRWLGK